MNYHKYINSKQWKEKRILFSASSCEFCGSKKFLQVHHRHYNSLGKELPGDLVTLCGICHTNIHFDVLSRKIKRWQSGSELYLKARLQNWSIKGWRKRLKLNKYRLRAGLTGKDSRMDDKALLKPTERPIQLEA